MRKVLSVILTATVLLSLPSCVKEFLQKPQSSDVTATEVFSSKENAMTAIAQAYSDALRINLVLNQDTPNTYGLEYDGISLISGENMGYRYNWQDPVMISANGMSATDSDRRIDNFGFNYTAIRRCYTVMEDIDIVPDMTKEEKASVKAEMLTLIAYRYCRMLIQYGGVPIVNGLLDFGTRGCVRKPVEDVLVHIVKLCDEAISDLPDTWDNANIGRLTKGAALCIKAQAYLYCARPLFNTDKPYLPMANPEDNKLLCMGKPYNEDLWVQAKNAAQAVIDWAADGHKHWIIDTNDPLNDYGYACAAPNSEEVIVRLQHVTGLGDPRTEGGAANNMTYEQLRQYYKADGTDQVWPMFPVTGTRADYQSRIEEMEPRYWASATPGGYNCKTNEGVYDWESGPLAWASSWEGRTNIEHCGRRTKMWYKASARTWFNFPIYRLAYFYLALAEAENELGQQDAAITAMHPIRDRAGLPDLAASDKETLRAAIQREWAIEFFEENCRLFDVKHWKLSNLGNGIIGGEKLAFWFEYDPANKNSWSVNNYVSYTVKSHYQAFWGDNQYLNPFPSNEVNKGEIIQNPGY